MRPLHCMFVAASLFVGACEAKTQQEVVDEATRAAQEAKRQAEQGVEVARDGTRKVVDEATRKAEQGAEIAARKAEQGMAEARSQLADARARLELAKKDLDRNMDDAAVAFEEAAEEAAETSKKQADQLGKQADQLGKQADQLGKQLGEAKSGLQIAPDAILCDENSQRRICRISPDLIAELATEPRMLAREVSLRPGKGDTGKGLELAKAAAEGFAAALGLREGDILLELNGAKLDSFGAIRELDGALSGKPEAKLIYEREGQREELTVVQQF